MQYSVGTVEKIGSRRRHRNATISADRSARRPLRLCASAVNTALPRLDCGYRVDLTVAEVVVVERDHLAPVDDAPRRWNVPSDQLQCRICGATAFIGAFWGWKSSNSYRPPSTAETPRVSAGDVLIRARRPNAKTHPFSNRANRRSHCREIFHPFNFKRLTNPQIRYLFLSLLLNQKLLRSNSSSGGPRSARVVLAPGAPRKACRLTGQLWSDLADGSC
jgi:hypothetical protein